MIPSAKIAIRESPPPGEQVEQAEDVGAAELLLDVVDRREVDARHRHVRAEAVDQQHRRREGDLLADVRDLEGVEDRGEHGDRSAARGASGAATTAAPILVDDAVRAAGCTVAGPR